MVLANGAARGCLAGGTGAAALVDTPLFGLLAPASASAIQVFFDSLTDGQPVANRVLTWRLAWGETAVTTELKLIAAARDLRLIMLTFAPSLVGAELASALDRLPFDLLILDKKLNVAYANGGAVRSSGVVIGEILGRSALTFAPTNALPREVYFRALDGCHYHDDSVEIPSPPAPVRFFEMDVRPWEDAAGVVAGLVVLSTVLSKRRMLTSLLGATEHRLRMFTENAGDVISVVAADGRLQYVSGGVRNILGFTTEEQHLNSIFEHAHPDDAGTVRKKFQQLVSGKMDRFSHQYRVRHKDGTYRWLDTVYVSALDDPLINGVVINSRDITKRKQAESLLAQREEVFRLAADAVDGVIFEWDVASGIVHRSRGVFEILGLEPDELTPAADAWDDRIHPLDFPVYKRQIGLALIEGRGWTSSYRIRDARGRYRSMLERALIQRSANGDPVRAIGCSVDVSEIKRLTDLLAETQRTAQTGGWEYSYTTGELTWTDEMFRIYETSAGEFDLTLDSVLGQCTPESRQRFIDALTRAESSDGQLDLEVEMTTLKNRRIWIRVICHVERLDGRPFRAFGSVQNIQAQKLAQIALENSTGWLKLSMNVAHMHAWRWDKASDVVEFAVEGEMAHLPAGLPVMKELLTLVHPSDRLAASRAIENAFQHGSDVRAEIRVKANDGRYRSYETVARPLFDSAGAPQGLVGVTQDVTARRESEAQLRRSEQLLRTTTANTADVLMLLDTDLRIRFINQSIRGMSIEQIVGSDISAVLPEKARAMVIAKLRHVLDTGETATYEFEDAEARELRYLDSRAVLVRDAGIGTGISVSVRNITERKRLEQEILHVSSRERQTIGRDLHDGLGQELTGVALMLRGLATRIQRDAPAAVDYVNEIVGLVNQSIETARSLARGLLPVRTDGGGLPFALRALAARSRDLYGLEVNFRAELWPQLVLDEASASHLYRIAQEALTNAARHGHASKVDICLLVARNTFSLQITDDGTGIGKSDHPIAGMGLKTMRYRAGMIGAKFEIEPNVPHGTVVQVTGEQPAAVGALYSVPQF